MPTNSFGFIAFAASIILLPNAVFAQAVASKPSSASSDQAATSATRGIQLAEASRCKEALVLLRPWTHVADPDLKRRSGLAVIRCGMSTQNEEVAVGAIVSLRKMFPEDPDVLYVTTHAYSDLATQAAGELGVKAASSYQAHELDAEALEQQGKWTEAEAQYRLILEQNPNLPGIHFRIGRLILSRPANDTTNSDAKAEFEAELKIDPNNAGAEYVLGELAAGGQQWDDAIPHFSRAVKLDPTFSDAFRSLGMAYNADQKFADAVAPLEAYTKLQPDDPAGHYQLAIAYARTGHKDQASQQMALQRQLDAKARKVHDGQDPNAVQ